MAPPPADLATVAAAVGYTIPEDQVADYTAMLEKQRQAYETVMAMEDYQPQPDLEAAPRLNVHFPKKEDNPLNAWAWKCTCTHASPTSTLLKGKTICLKDNIALASVPCLLGTDSFTGWTPSSDATIATRILLAGGTIAGKAVCENLSRGAVSSSAATGPVDNPWAEGYSAGGSSSGTGALVGGGWCDLGVGCDQGGSVRIPAAMCGIYGMKATVGLVPYTGIASNDASVDFVGPMTRTAGECALLLQVMAGVDGLDDRQVAGTPFPGEVPKYLEIMEASRDGGIKGMRIGVLREGMPTDGIMDAGLKAKFEAAVRELEKLGATVGEVSVPLHSSARTVYTVMSKMGNHMGMLGRGAPGRRQVVLTDLLARKDLPYTPDALARMSVFSREGLLSGELGWHSYPLAHGKAVNASRRLRDAYDAALGEWDVLVMPTTLTPPDRLPAPDASPAAQMAANKGKTENTAPFNATGHPALAVPIGFVDSGQDGGVRVPASMQVVGRYWAESTLFRVAYAFERAVDWKTF